MVDIAKDIIMKAATGDVGAFEEIYRAFSSAVYTIALNITQNREDAEEAAPSGKPKIILPRARNAAVLRRNSRRLPRRCAACGAKSRRLMSGKRYAPL
jgi:hypothetical protein